MRNSILIILILFSYFVSSAQTSVYHPFPKTNTGWGVDEWWHGVPPATKTGSHFYTINGSDTTIGSYTYIKVFKGTIPSLFGGFRDDSTNRKVYGIIFPAPAIEFILYDFNLNIGDTFVHFYTNLCQDSTTYSTVYFVDSVLIGGTYRKRIHFDEPLLFTSGPLKFIEGVGSTTGLFNCYYQGEFTYNLCAFNQVGKPPHNFCSSSTSIEEEIKTQIQIYPNPSSSKVSLRFNKFLNNASIFIYDAQSKLVKKFENLNGDSYNFSCEDLNNGIYIVKIFEANKMIATKKLSVNKF